MVEDVADPAHGQWAQRGRRTGEKEDNARDRAMFCLGETTDTLGIQRRINHRHEQPRQRQQAHRSPQPAENRAGKAAENRQAEQQHDRGPVAVFEHPRAHEAPGGAQHKESGKRIRDRQVSEGRGQKRVSRQLRRSVGIFDQQAVQALQIAARGILLQESLRLVAQRNAAKAWGVKNGFAADDLVEFLMHGSLRLALPFGGILPLRQSLVRVSGQLGGQPHVKRPRRLFQFHGQRRAGYLVGGKRRRTQKGRHPHIHRAFGRDVEKDRQRKTQRIGIAHHPHGAAEIDRLIHRLDGLRVANRQGDHDEHGTEDSGNDVEPVPRQPSRQEDPHDGRADDRPDAEEPLQRIHDPRVFGRGHHDIADQRQRPGFEDPDRHARDEKQPDEIPVGAPHREQERIERKERQAQHDGDLAAQFVRQKSQENPRQGNRRHGGVVKRPGGKIGQFVLLHDFVDDLADRIGGHGEHGEHEEREQLDGGQIPRRWRQS